MIKQMIKQMIKKGKRIYYTIEVDDEIITLLDIVQKLNPEEMPPDELIFSALLEYGENHINNPEEDVDIRDILNYTMWKKKMIQALRDNGLLEEEK